jgi:DNA-binding SARP family transcriptional activator
MPAVSDPNHSAFSGSSDDCLVELAAAPIQIRLLGGLSIVKLGGPIGSRAGARTEQLLLSLALARTQGLTRERLISQIWPEADVSLPAQSLHSLLHTLHRVVGDAIGGAMPVVHDGEIYRLNFDAGIAVDVTEFDGLAHRGDRAWREGLHTLACDDYRRAVALYRGDLHVLEDESLLVERERLRASYLGMLGRLADVARRAGDHALAIEYASRVLQYDAGREDAHRVLMASYAQLGQRVQAMQQYQLCERVLRVTFDAVPEPATHALYDCLRLRPGADLEKEFVIA